MSRAKVVVEESVVRVITVGQQGPPGPAGEDGADVGYVDAGDTASRARANHTGTQPASTISDFPTAVDARVAIQKGVANGLATLGSDNKIPSAQLPAIAITDTFPVASQAAMLALTAEVGDVAVRSDLNKSFILKTAGASTLGNWQELLTPTDAVLSVNGQTGAVTGLAEDSAVAHNTGNETWAGIKTFSSAPVVPSAAFPQSAISGLTADLAAKAALDSPALTGAPTAPTADPGTATIQLATTAFVAAAVIAGTPDATSSVKGKIQLAGDLGGTAASPEVTSTHLSAALPIAQGGTGGTTAGAALAALGAATDSLVVHLASTETVTDAKTFNAGAFLDKGNLVFNVKAYGAVGDGVMDDKAALQAAHDAIGSAGGKIYVPAGTYLMNSKWLISKSNIEIELAPGAVLKAAAGAANLSVGAGGGLVHIWKSSGTQTNVYFHGAAIDLNNVAEVNALEIWGAGSDADIWATTDNPGPLDLSPRRTLRPHTPQQHGPIIISQQQRPHTVRHGQLSRDKH